MSDGAVGSGMAASRAICEVMIAVGPSTAVANEAACLLKALSIKV